MTTRSDERTNAPPWGTLRRVFSFDETGILLAVALFVVIGAASSPYFLTLNNLTGILQNITFLGFLSVGVGLTLMAGEIDTPSARSSASRP